MDMYNFILVILLYAMLGFLCGLVVSKDKKHVLIFVVSSVIFTPCLLPICIVLYKMFSKSKNK